MKKEFIKELNAGADIDTIICKYHARGLSNNKILQYLKDYRRGCMR